LLLISPAFCHAQTPDCNIFDYGTNNELPTINVISPSVWNPGQTYTVAISGSWEPVMPAGCNTDTVTVWENSVYPYPLTNIDPYVTVSNITYVSATETDFTVTIAANAPTEYDAVQIDCHSACGLFNEVRIGASIQPPAPPPPPACTTPAITAVTPDIWIAGKTYNKVTITGSGFTDTQSCPAPQVNMYDVNGSKIPFSNVKVISATEMIARKVAPPTDTPTETACVTVGTRVGPQVVSRFAIVGASATPAPGTAGSPCTDPYGNSGITVQIFSDACKAALATANKKQAAVTRAENAWSVLQTAAEAHDIDPALLAAIGVRETGFENVQETLQNGEEGHGMGVFQLTNQPGVTAAQAYDLTFAANYAANMLSNNENILSNEFPAFTPDQLLQATAASYNIGTDPNTGISGNPNTIDVGTAPGGIRGNYGSNVVGLMSCFQQP
jgi:hypothetical protein